MKRSSIGWLNSKLLPNWVEAAFSSRSIRASLSSFGSGQLLRSFRMMTPSEMFGGMGSTAASAVPVREKTVSTSGWALMTRSSAICIARDCSSEADGTRRAWMAISPSSSVGMNSRPNEEKARPPISRAPSAAAATARGLATAARIAGCIQRRAKRRMKVSCSCA
ncbi:hypothetical protein D3C85_968160 [compost metagenome]